MRIVGMIPVYNESDIVGHVIEHLISQGLELIILDNGSTDRSYEIVSKYLEKGVLSIERRVTERFEWGLILENLYEMALKHRPDWTLISSADEFHESPYPNLNLKEAIELEEERGYNLVQFNNFEFWPTEKDVASEPDARRRMKYYTWNDDCQFHCWKVSEGINVRDGGGHYPIFPRNVRVRVSPTKYVLRHYRIRSHQHGVRKIFEERLPRYSEEEREIGWHVHYDKFGRDEKFFVIDSRNLNRYDDNHEWSLKKTFDWTWGLQAKAWAKPPIPPNISTRIANRFPIITKTWKMLFLRKHHRSTREAP